MRSDTGAVCFPVPVPVCALHMCCDGQGVAQCDGNSLERLHLIPAVSQPVSISELGVWAAIPLQVPIIGWCLQRCAQVTSSFLLAAAVEEKTLK